MSRNALQELDDFEVVFKALAHSSRRHILTVVNARGGVMTAGEIAQRFSCSWPTTTRHLRQLETAGLLRVEKKGRESLYHLNSARLLAVTSHWLKWFQTDEENKP